MSKPGLITANPGFALLKTKFQIPSTPDLLIPRPQLVKRLDGDQPLVVISAPPGSGKTTLLTAWAAHQPDDCVAWLSLDELDNDLSRFLAYLLAAVQGYADDSVEPSITEILRRLEALPLTIILDNYHLITNAAVHDATLFMIEYLPVGARLMISTRTHPPLPLARLRASGHLNEINDLRLTLEESAAFLEVSPDTETAMQLTERTEGWIAGLQLAKLMGADASQFGGSYRHVYDYFMEEVFTGQPSATQSFLLYTSILDELSADVCNAVTGRSDGQVMLERLEQSNLFITPLDELRHAYRYHRLFAEFLRECLRKQQDSDLPHVRAAEWYANRGVLAPAIDHALAAGAFERAAELIQRFAEIGTNVRPWIDQLPDEVISLYPALRMLAEPYPANIEPLSEREVEVLHLISHGMSNPEIARRLIIAVSTVKTHVKNIYRKLDVDTRYEAMQRARELDLLRIRLEGEYRRLIK